MKPTASFILKIVRKKENGKYPLIIRVIYLREKHEYRTKLEFTEEEYANCIAERPIKKYREAAANIITEKERVKNIIDNLKVFTFKKFEDAYYNRIKEAKDLFVFFDDYVKQLEIEGRYKTAVSYKTAKNSFKEFDEKIGLYDITSDFLKKYHHWMLEKGNSTTTIGIYVRSLRAIFNYAIDIGVIKKEENYPFGLRKYIIPAGRNIKKALTPEEVSSIYRYKTIPGTPIDFAKDLWIFSYVCNGINFKDIAMLRWSNVDGDILHFVREKTKKTSQGNKITISCHLSEPAKKIIKKWSDKKNAAKDAYLFSILDENDTPLEQMRKIEQLIKNTNKYIRRICMSLNIEKNVTTYFARHSAATIMKHSGASIAQIQEALGHSTQSVTQKYLDSFNDNAKKELSNALTKFFE
ncbi:MAG: site-specific integrase [Bacteroidota bacterium]|nr:site-specific integrase [Bacteroidota bacterium]